MKLVTWNIQWGLGIDGRVDLKRIVDTARAWVDFDVLCLQEVTRNYPALRGNDGADQFAQLAALLPGFHAVEGIAVDRLSPQGVRQQFGNMILTRFAPLQTLHHQLPWPAEPALPTMPRMALEAVIDAPSGPLRVTTTHLEYYSATQRTAQADALRAIQCDAASHAANQAQPPKIGSPFESRPRNARGVLTGDFNCTSDDALIARMQQPISQGATAYRDAWCIAHPGTAHASTVGVFDQSHWDGRAPCIDFIFVSEDLAHRVTRVEVNSMSRASDHQPMLKPVTRKSAIAVAASDRRLQAVSRK